MVSIKTKKLYAVIVLFQPRKARFRVDRDKLAHFIFENGLPPKKASCLCSGYWAQASKAACDEKTVTPRLAKAVSIHWYADRCNFKANILRSLEVSGQYNCHD